MKFQRAEIAHPERGATAIFLAFAMLLLLGFAAIAVDVGRGFVERRADQSAVDMASTAGGTELLVGASGAGVTPADMVDAALEYAEVNLPTEYGSSEWQAIWEACVDPPSARNTEPGDNFVAMPAPSGWSPVQPANWCISADAAKSLFRVRVPDQIVNTTFGRLLGVTELTPSAAAVVSFEAPGAGILPFGLPSGVSDGVQHCLSSAPTGLADDPCEGPDQGNFGVIRARIFGDSPYNGCNSAPTNSVLALNIAAGIDHVVVPAPDTSPANEVRDECFNFPVNTLETDPGNSGHTGVGNGLATGAGLPAGEVARLRQGPQVKQSVIGNPLDDAPLWNWLVPATGGTAPGSCSPSAVSSWPEMGQCLEDYVAGNHDGVIFSAALGDTGGSNWSARFGYTPQFHEASLGPGISWRHIWRFRAIFIQGTWWHRGTTWVIHHPGEGCVNDLGDATSCNSGPPTPDFKQVSGWIIPDSALPSELRGGASVGINPFTMLLER